MTIADIAEKKAEERKREKRLVHLANTLSREFTDSLKVKSKSQKDFVEYLSKAFLDYLFFDRHKEIGELSEDHIYHFLLEYAPQKLSFDKESGKEIPGIVSNLVQFLDDAGYIKNSSLLVNFINQQSKHFNKLIREKKTETGKAEPKIKKEQSRNEDLPRVGRNDPCPCGSGKKYKKCCGRNIR